MDRPRGRDLLRLAVFVTVGGGALYLFAGLPLDVETASGTLGRLEIQGETLRVFRPSSLDGNGNSFLAAVPGRVPLAASGTIAIPAGEGVAALPLRETRDVPEALGEILEMRADPGAPPDPPDPGLPELMDPETVILLYPGTGEWTEMTLAGILRHPNGRAFAAAHARRGLKEMGPWGPVVYVLLCTLGTIILFPATIMWIAGALSFGPWLGTVVVYLGANLGACCAFLSGRWAARETVERILPQRLKDLSDALETAGFRTILLLRLIPVMPYNALNYACSISRMRFRDYALGGAIGMVPMVFIWVQATVAASRIRLGDPLTWGPILLLLLLLLVPYLWGMFRGEGREAPGTG